jgi:hypothetical protein
VGVLVNPANSSFGPANAELDAAARLMKIDHVSQEVRSARRLLRRRHPAGTKTCRHADRTGEPLRTGRQHEKQRALRITLPQSLAVRADRIVE